MTVSPPALLRLLLAIAFVAGLVLPAGAREATGPQQPPAGFSVVGGQASAEGAWPAVVALVRAEESDAVLGQLCAGTAIAADLVLTAAHCVHNSSGDVVRTPDQIRVVAGRSDLSATGGIEVHGTALYVHPSYDAGRRRNDVAVLRVDGPLGVPLQPLVARNATGPFEGDVATVVGWGRTGAGDGNASRRTARLHEAPVRVPGDDVCREAFGGTLDLRVHLCAGGGGTPSPAPDACVGDSGGPLLLPDADGTPVQVGITSFGPVPCGMADPGVYVRLASMRDFTDAVIAGSVDPTILPGDEVAPPAVDGVRPTVRVADPDAEVTATITQAVASSRAVFDAGRAELAVISRDDGFADALAGSSLGYGRGPILFTPPTGDLAESTRAELLRAVQPGATVYLLGGEAAVPAGVESQLATLGFLPVRLAGPTREVTAVAIAEEVVRRHGLGSLPFGTAVLVTAHAWPDAVSAGQLGVWWGYPVLLTPADRLHEATADALTAMQVRRLIVVGGASAVSERVTDRVSRLLPDVVVTRLAGSNRIETGVRVAEWHRVELAATGKTSGAVVAVNMRREDGFAHVLAATPILGATAGLFLPLEGEDGSGLGDDVAASFCGVGGLPVVIGGTDLVAAGMEDRLSGILSGTGC
ncbi:hypothetical protein BH23ACT9_BH23ACT9_34650 [soil metagenome]